MTINLIHCARNVVVVTSKWICLNVLNGALKNDMPTTRSIIKRDKSFGLHTYHVSICIIFTHRFAREEKERERTQSMIDAPFGIAPNVLYACAYHVHTYNIHKYVCVCVCVY